ncbi:hypothetical protein KKE26_04825 [bacterium]|nr:hypothetical protein [bacterium]
MPRLVNTNEHEAFATSIVSVNATVSETNHLLVVATLTLHYFMQALDMRLPLMIEALRQAFDIFIDIYRYICYIISVQISAKSHQFSR